MATSLLIAYYGIKTRTFIIDRIIRLYPVFLPVLILIFCFGPFLGYDYFHNETFFNVIILFFINLLFIPGIYPIEAALVVAWSLSYEALFYIYAASLKALKSNSYFIVFFTIFFIIPTLTFYPRSIFFIIGSGIYFYRENNIPVFFRAPKAFSLFLCLFLGALFVHKFHAQLEINLSAPLLLLVWYSSIVFGFLFFIEIADSSRFSDFLLLNKFMLMLGTISYSFYIWHTPVLFATKRIFRDATLIGNDYTRFLTYASVSFLTAIIISYISYIVLEKHIPKRLSNILKK